MRPVQSWARKNRVNFFLPELRAGDRILEVGSGTNWFQPIVESTIPVSYQTIDSEAPADIRGDIRDWKMHGLRPASLDAIIAFEVVEHVDCFAACHELLIPGGRMLLTTPMPHFDWVLQFLEAIHLTQKRTSPHSNLVYIKNIPGFTVGKSRNPFGLGQWVILQKQQD